MGKGEAQDPHGCGVQSLQGVPSLTDLTYGLQPQTQAPLTRLCSGALVTDM